MTKTDLHTLRFIGKLNRDAIDQRNRADWWQRVALLLWATNLGLCAVIWWLA